MEPIKINLTAKIDGVKELNVKSIVERDNELVIELNNDESYFVKVGTRLRFMRKIYSEGKANNTIFEYVDVLSIDNDNKIHTTTIAPKKVRLLKSVDAIKQKEVIEKKSDGTETKHIDYYITTKEPHNIFPQDVILGVSEFIIKDYKGNVLLSLTNKDIKISNIYGNGYITSDDCISLLYETETCGKRYDSVKTYVYNFHPIIISKDCLIIRDLLDKKILENMSYIELRHNPFYFHYKDDGEKIETDKYGKPIKKCGLRKDLWWGTYKNSSDKEKQYINEGDANTILCYDTDYWTTNIGLSSPVNENTLGSSDNFSTSFVKNLEQSLIPEVIDMERVKYSPVIYKDNKEIYYKLVSYNDEKYPIIYTKKWVSTDTMNNGDVISAFIKTGDTFEQIDDREFSFYPYEGGGILISGNDNSVDPYTYYPTDEIVNDALNIATGITISMHFRKRVKKEDSNIVNTNITSGNVYADGWFIDEDNNQITWWNGMNYSQSAFSATTFNEFINNSGTTSDLIGYLNFTDDDIFYRKKKVSQSFLRFSFYNSPDPIEQKLLFYSTSFLDSTTLYGKYLKQMMYMNDNDLFNEKKNKDINLNAAVVFCSANTDSRVDTKIVLTNEYDTTKSSEGFNIYLFSEDRNLNLENGEKTIYMKVEFNHAGNGKTIPMIMWPKDKNGNYIPLKTYNYLENLYIPIKLAYIDGKYVYYIPSAKNNDDGNIDLILWEPKLDIINIDEELIN